MCIHAIHFVYCRMMHRICIVSNVFIYPTRYINFSLSQIKLYIVLQLYRIGAYVKKKYIINFLFH